MAVTDETITLANGLRVQIDAQVDQTTRTLTERWVLAWDELSLEWQDAVTDVIDLIEDGDWPSRAQLDRLSRVRQALGHTLDSLDKLATETEVEIINTVGDTVELTEDWHERLIGSQLPADAAAFGIRWDRTDTDAMAAMIERITGQVTAETFPLSREATEAMWRALIRGVSTGQNPRRIAREMLARLESEFNGGLARALNIARTEILDAYREASRIRDQANREVVTVWVWLCTFSRRTCPSCLAQHGSEHPISEPGPLDHQSGRCTRLTRTKSWKDLGFTQKEPPAVDFPDARAWFASLPFDQQVAIMGRGKLGALLSGQIGWDDLSTRRSTRGWRDSYGVTRLRDLVPS